MTLQERDDLTRFLQLLVQAQSGPKDPDAQALIGEAVARQPDAAYLLVQRVLQLEHALKEATQPKTSFVGDANAWGRAPVASQPSTAAPVQVPMQQTPTAVPAAAAAPASRWGSGLMGTLAMTAGGVVAGSLLAQGIGSLFGSHHNNAANGANDSSAIPPGGGALVETNYGGGSANEDADGGYVADDFDGGGDSGDSGDVG